MLLRFCLSVPCDWSRKLHLPFELITCKPVTNFEYMNTLSFPRFSLSVWFFFKLPMALFLYWKTIVFRFSFFHYSRNVSQFLLSLNYNCFVVQKITVIPRGEYRRSGVLSFVFLCSHFSMLSRKEGIPIGSDYIARPTIILHSYCY